MSHSSPVSALLHFVSVISRVATALFLIKQQKKLSLSLFSLSLSLFPLSIVGSICPFAGSSSPAAAQLLHLASHLASTLLPYRMHQIQKLQ